MALTRLSTGLFSADSASVNLNIDAGTLYIDATTNRVGVGNTSPSEKLTVNGALAITGALVDDRTSTGAIDFSGGITRFVSYGASGVGGIIAFRTASGGASSAERMRIDSSGNVGIGTATITNPYSQALFTDVNINGTWGGAISFQLGGVTKGWIGQRSSGNEDMVIGATTGQELLFYENNVEAARISSGHLLVGKSSTSFSTAGASIYGDATYKGLIEAVIDGQTCMNLNRLTNDGSLIGFYQAGVNEGSISVSGGTVSYNGGHLSRWSQLADNTKDETIVKGTVMTNLNQMAEWTTDGVTEDNEQLNCMAVSSVEGDVNVAGVFVNWDNDDEVYTADMNVAMTGDMVIRIAQGVTVAQGDLLMSAGDGTAKPQDDDIIRAKTIAKVTSTHVSHTYDDGSYLVPCVLMAC